MALQSLLGSTSMRRALMHFAARPASRLHFRALERRLGVARQSLKNTLDTLEALGLVTERPSGGASCTKRPIRKRGPPSAR